MIEVLGELIRDIAIIIIITTFLELLMPNTGMRRYIQLVLGLFVIITLLNPVMNFLNKEPTFEVSTSMETKGKEELKTILADAESFSRQSNEDAAGEYKRSLERQIASLARLISGVEDVFVIVRLEQTGWVGNIKEVSLKIQVAGEVVPGREVMDDPIEIGLGAEMDKKMDRQNKHTENSIETQVTTTICDFYNLAPEMVNVEIIKT